MFLLSFLGCQTISTKVDEATKKEEQELSKWIGKTESELTSSLGNLIALILEIQEADTMYM